MIPQSYTRGVVDKQEVGFVRNVITIIELRKQLDERVCRGTRGTF